MRSATLKGGLLFLAMVTAAPGCTRREAASRGVKGIRARGVLRVVVRPGSPMASRQGPGSSEQAAMLERVASRLGVRLEIREAKRNGAVLEAVADGRADLAVWRFPVPRAMSQRVVPSAPLGWVDDLLVTGRGGQGAAPVVRMHRSNPYWGASEVCGEDGARCLPVPEEVPLEEVLARTASGRYGATVADSALLMGSGISRRLHRARVLAERRPLSWYLPAGGGEFKALVDEVVFARRVLTKAASPPACLDLSGIKKRGRLRLVTRNGPTTCTVEHGGLSGFEYELARRFARRLGVRLELSVPPRGTDPLDWLEAGRGDLAALHEPATTRARRTFLVAEGYRRVDFVTVCSQDETCSGEAAVQTGFKVAAPGFAGELTEILWEGSGAARIPLPRGADALDALSRVAKGRADVAVVDSDTARIQLEDWAGLTLGDVVATSQPLAWIVNVSAPRLARAVRRFLAGSVRDGTVTILARTTLDPGPHWKPASLPEIPTYALTPWDAQLKRAALASGIDWRLLASLMYEESRFDPRAVGPGGSAGLFQFMPATWKWLGVEDPFDPEQAIPAGARYLRMLMDEFDGLELADQVAMAVASYNVGPAHVMDARRLARRMGLNPDVWRDNVETAMVILDDPEVARRFPAGVCRCRRAVAYTRRILRRYVLYTQQF